jgi:hypothetical protein
VPSTAQPAGPDDGCGPRRVRPKGLGLTRAAVGLGMGLLAGARYLVRNRFHRG